MSTITLTNDGRSWIATTTGPNEALLLELFGTTSLATAFTAEASPELVRANIQRLNPSARVVVAPDHGRFTPLAETVRVLS